MRVHGVWGGACSARPRLACAARLQTCRCPGKGLWAGILVHGQGTSNGGTLGLQPDPSPGAPPRYPPPPPQVGSFPNWDVWAEWNGKYRDDVRRFLRCVAWAGLGEEGWRPCWWAAGRQAPCATRGACPPARCSPVPRRLISARPRASLPSRPPCSGDGGLKSEFATRLAGSADLYHTNNRKPFHSINFVIAHDGFTLADQVAYNEKHNDANGEGNRECVRGGGGGEGAGRAWRLHGRCW